MAQRSNMTAAELLALAPENPLDQAECVDFFAECMRWAEIERYEPIHETAWMGLVEQDRLCKRNIHLLALKAEIEAYIEIYSIETITPPDLNPSEPSCDTAASSQTITWPEEGAAATAPVLPTREGL